MEMNRSLLEAELKVLMEVSTDFARGLSTVAARTKLLKSCLDKLHDGHVSRVDRATSPIVFPKDRSTSISPLRFKSPEKILIKEEKADIKEETAEAPEEQNYCDINFNQEERASYNNEENSINDLQVRTSLVRHEQQPMEVSCNITTSDAYNDVPTPITNRTASIENSNVQTSYYLVKQANGLTIPVGASQLQELGLSKNPVHQITVQHDKPLEEDISYAMQVYKKDRSNDGFGTVAYTVGSVSQELIQSSKDETEPVMSKRVKYDLINRRRDVVRRTNAEKREHKRVRQAKYRAVHQRKMNDGNEKVSQKGNLDNNLNIALSGGVKNDAKQSDTHNVFILRKDLIKKTYARKNRQMETS